MNTIKSFGHTWDVLPSTSHSLANFGRALRTYWGAFAEGLAAARAYNEMTRRGVPHAVAVKAIFNEHFDA
jgi:hypothetical protein